MASLSDDYLLFLQSMKDYAILVLNAEGMVIFSNDAIENITGYTASEIVHKPFDLLYTEGERQANKLPLTLEKAADSGRAEEEGWQTRKNGSRCWANTVINPICDHQNRLTGYTVVMRDMTTHKASEQELKRSEEKHRLLVEGVKDYGIFMLDPSGMISSWNDGGRQITGYSSYEIIGKPFSLFFTNPDQEIKKPERVLAETLEKGKYNEEGWRVKKNGSFFWAAVVITPLFNDRNQHTGFAHVIHDLTEQKESERSLRESEEQRRLLIQSVKDYAIFMLDPMGVIISWNEGARRIKGYTEEEITGKHFSIFYSLAERESEKPWRELTIAKTRGTYEEEGWRIRKDGSMFWANVVITAIHNNAGQHIGFSKVTRDLTWRKDAERALRESEERARLLMENVKDYGIFMLDPDGIVTSWNEGVKRIEGYAAYEVIGKHFSLFYPPEDIASDRPAIELGIAKSAGKYEQEGWRIRKDGSRFWASVAITSIISTSNELVGFSNVTRDLTERRAIEETLRNSEERYRLLVGQVKDYGIFMLDEKGRIISWNEGAKRINGFESADILQKHFSIFYPQADVDNEKPALELKIAREYGKYEEEGWRVRKDGSLFWASVVITAIHNDAGALIGFAKVTRDLTERKKAEQALRESEERSRKLAEETNRANIILAYANQELEQFTSIASHDLQEPLRTVKSFLTLVDSRMPEDVPENLKIYIHKSIDATDRMRELIQNLLQYTQVSKQEIVRESVSVEDLVSTVLQNLKGSVETTGASVTLENGVPFVQGDRTQLLQLIQNLVGNAIKFSAGNVPQVRIRTVQKNGEYMFSVSDNGVGIAPENHHKVFEIFKRLAVGKYQGTGIGLSICKRIVERHQGKIWIESELGKGTTFHFTLPAHNSGHVLTEKI
jgi:PAS domain S-box-containing protein